MEISDFSHYKFSGTPKIAKPEKPADIEVSQKPDWLNLNLETLDDEWLKILIQSKLFF